MNRTNGALVEKLRNAHSNCRQGEFLNGKKNWKRPNQKKWQAILEWKTAYKIDTDKTKIKPKLVYQTSRNQAA